MDEIIIKNVNENETNIDIENRNNKFDIFMKHDSDVCSTSSALCQITAVKSNIGDESFNDKKINQSLKLICEESNLSLNTKYRLETKVFGSMENVDNSTFSYEDNNTQIVNSDLNCSKSNNFI
jgi:hypothetical protein